jgi:hypothetical protein
LPGQRINGELTLGENIADLSGLTMALRVYRLSLGGQRAAVMDGFTGEQLFFLGWAQMWRGKIWHQALRAQLLSDPHSPKEFRTTGLSATCRNITPPSASSQVTNCSGRPTNASKSGNRHARRVWALRIHEGTIASTDHRKQAG